MKRVFDLRERNVFLFLFSVENAFLFLVTFLTQNFLFISPVSSMDPRFHSLPDSSMSFLAMTSAFLLGFPKGISQKNRIGTFFRNINILSSTLTMALEFYYSGRDLKRTKGLCILMLPVSTTRNPKVLFYSLVYIEAIPPLKESHMIGI